MTSVEIRSDHEGFFITVAEGGSPADGKHPIAGQQRGIFSTGPNLQKLKSALGSLALELVEAFEPAKTNTKEITLELALELTSSLDLKLVDVHSAAKLKVVIKI